jgi:hypothetical protein
LSLPIVRRYQILLRHGEALHRANFSALSAEAATIYVDLYFLFFLKKLYGIRGTHANTELAPYTAFLVIIEPTAKIALGLNRRIEFYFSLLRCFQCGSKRVRHRRHREGVCKNFVHPLAQKL